MRLQLALILALAASPLQAATRSSDVSLRDYVHTVWMQHDGVPLGRIIKILQTSDGYLWVLSRDEGLLRFDGMRFVRASTPCTQPMTRMASAADGGFWAVCGQQLIRRTAQARFVEVPQTVLEPRSLAPWLFVDREGRPWFVGERVRYLDADGTRGGEMVRPTAGPIRAAAADADGTLWVSDTKQVVHVYPDRTEAVALGPAWCLVRARDGGVFALSSERAWRLRPRSAPEEIDGITGVRLSGADTCVSDAGEGGLWFGTKQHGVALLHRGSLETLPDADQRIRNVDALFVDREGTMWAGASTGLHRFRKPAVRMMPAIADHLRVSPTFVFVDSRDNVWVGPGLDDGVSRMSASGVWTSVEPHEHTYWGIGEDETGRIWLSNTRDIGYVTNGRFVPVRDAANAPVKEVASFKRDGRGHLWAVSSRVGVYRVTPGPPRLMVESRDAAPDFLISERSGIWIALANRGVERHLNGRSTFFPDEHSGDVNATPRTIVEDGDGVWIGTRRSLRRWRNGVWTVWTREHGLPGDGSVEEIVPDRLGHFWIMTPGGLLKLPRAPLDATPDGAPRALSYARVGAMDGIVATASSFAPSPRASTDTRGRLYVATVDTVFVVDPSAVSGASLAPPIVLESVTVDGRAADAATAGRLVEPSLVQFDYTSLSLLSPEYARFRYRLDGYDADWIEAGAQRHVTYAMLRPGTYRFHVIGASSEGVWNEQGASFAFQVVPVYWRTWWFRLAALASGSVIVAGLYQLRVHQLTRRFNIGLDARVAERTRIARDLHDTLLQTFQGVLIHFQAATNLLPGRPDDARRRLDSVLDQAANAIAEGRDAVQALRSSAGAADDLAHAIGALGDDLARERDGGPAAIVRVHVEGTARTLHGIVRDDVYRIASEAVRNAMRHAQARAVQVDIHYDERHLRVRIRDDGKGIDPGILADRAAAGHWGLPGMRERAALIGGKLDVRSRLGAGTEIDLSIPASQAYPASASWTRFWLRQERSEADS